MSTVADADRVTNLARQVVADHDPKKVPIPEFLGACYDAGLSWIHFPEGLGGLGLSRGLQAVADGILQGAGGPVPLGLNPMGYGMAAPTVREHAQSDDLKKELLRPLATTEHIWCQLFSEPGAGSDVAGLATSAVQDGDDWVINGQKVWTSLAHRARWGLLLARSNPDAPKHKGLTYFVLDMHAPGVETRPLRQLTGQAEFNEVYMTDTRIPDTHRLGAIGDGWRVAMTTLMNERSALGASGSRRGGGTISEAVSLWASRPDLQTPVLRDRLTQLWLRSEAQRLTSERSRASATVGGPGPEGSIGKLMSAELNQRIYAFTVDLMGADAMLYGSYEMTRGGGYRSTQSRFLRSRANTIEGGTTEVNKNIVAERVLGLPREPDPWHDAPWREVPRG